MSFYAPPWDSAKEPSDANVRSWLDNLYSKFQPVEQARWNQSNIDTLFYAGEQRFINSYFNFFPQFTGQNFNFNILQQMINMVTGYQRQHRKSIKYMPSERSDSTTTDQFNRVVTHAMNARGLLEKYSRACENSAVQGMSLIQPYLDFTDDPIHGTLDFKIWDYNAFLVDPYFREPDMSDANFVWTQQYLSKQEAIALFPDKSEMINGMMGTPQRYSRFYFLPENYNMARNDLLVMSYVWYKWRRKKKMLYNSVTKEMLDFTGEDAQLQEMLPMMDMLQEVEMEVSTWKLAVILNEQLVFQGENPLGFDECPFVPCYWNYDPQISYYDLRVRSLTRACRDAQFLFNRRIILNHDISESSINSGWKYKEDAISNPENLRYAGQGKDVIVKTGFEMTDIEKIIPNAVPASDMQLADQLMDLVSKTTGINQELLGASDDKQAGITELLRQGAGLITLQKYFDQWDTCLKLLGERILKIIQIKWGPEKVGRILNEEPSPLFFSKIFAKYHVTVAEGLNTATQEQQHFRMLMEINASMGGILPPQYLLQYAPIQGKQEVIQFLQQQQQQAQAVQEQQTNLEHTVLQAQLQNLYAKAASELATARERHGRSESNIGLLEERLSEVSKNQSLSVKAKMEAVEKLVDVIGKYGEIETQLKMNEIESLNHQEVVRENQERDQAKRSSDANKFITAIMSGQPQGEPSPQQSQLGRSVL